jgi:hypothetical protein
MLFSDFDLSLGGYFAVELLRFVRHRYGQFLLVAVDFKIVWHTPRVPAGAGSTKGHHALGYYFAVSTRYHNFGIE